MGREERSNKTLFIRPLHTFKKTKLHDNVFETRYETKSRRGGEEGRGGECEERRGEKRGGNGG